MSDEIGLGMRFVRSWIGGPMAGHLWIVRPNVRTITITDREKKLGRYVLCNLGWVWHEGEDL